MKTIKRLDGSAEAADFARRRENSGMIQRRFSGRLCAGFRVQRYGLFRIERCPAFAQTALLDSACAAGG
jgi:hypothetical protein